jgi:hypothetical protein
MNKLQTLVDPPLTVSSRNVVMDSIYNLVDSLNGEERIMDSRAAMIVSAIERATRHMKKGDGGYEQPPLDPHQPWKEHCSALFRETMRQLVAEKNQLKLYGDEDANANELGKRIRANLLKDWEEIKLEDAQARANQGDLIVGSYVNTGGLGTWLSFTLLKFNERNRLFETEIFTSRKRQVRFRPPRRTVRFQ